MKKTPRFKLRDAELIGATTVKPGITGIEYILALRSAAQGRKEPVSVSILERWVNLRFKADQLFSFDETMLEQFRKEMTTGTFKSGDGRKYRSMARQVPAHVFMIHNRIVGKHSAVVRKLIDSHRYARLSFLASLTTQTRNAINWFYEHGTRRMKNGQEQLMTQATRDGSISAVLWLLKEAGVNGLELIESEHLLKLLPDPDPNDHCFRKVSRWLHNCKPVYKACVRRGLLPLNPLENFSSSMFSAYAKRDFLSPSEVDRVRDLSTLNQDELEDDWELVRDRLVVLILIDTALRKSELAGIRLDDVKPTDDGAYRIRIAPEAQKMVGKPAAYIGTLYPETAILLQRYLEEIRPRFGGSMFIIDSNSESAQPEAIYKAVVREGTRMELKCYFSGKRPGPHALRRTFATVNAAPLGLCLTAAELAERMRTSYDIVNDHYIVHNPLRATLNEEEYRKRLVVDPARQGLAYVEKLAKLGLDGEILQQIRQRLASMGQPKPEPVALPVARDWMPEAAAYELLQEAWDIPPNPRTFRAYMKKHEATCRMGDYGGRHVDATETKLLIEQYVPLQQVLADSGFDTGSAVPVKYVTASIGRLQLVKRIEVANLIREIRGVRDTKLNGSPNCQTSPSGPVKRARRSGNFRERQVA